MSPANCLTSHLVNLVSDKESFKDSLYSFHKWLMFYAKTKLSTSRGRLFVTVFVPYAFPQ
jgi:hypothetical protein